MEKRMSKSLMRAAAAGLACAALTASLRVAAAVGEAATVEFTIGDVQVIGLNGQSRRAIKGLPVGSGDTVDTGSGRAQLRFTDGAYVSLQPQSKFRIDEYRFQGKTDGSERGFFSLLSGGMRTITGLVGRTNKRTYQVSTSVATIGIRGTEYKIAYTNSIEGVVGEGAINVCTGAGCFPFNSGETFMVPTPQSTPQLTRKQVDLPPPPVTDQMELKDLLVAGDTTTDTGAPVGLVLTGVVPNMIMADNGDGPLVFDVTDVTFDDGGMPVALEGSALSVEPDFGNNGVLAWWRTTADEFGFASVGIVGIPTPFTDLQLLALSQPVATYSMIGATVPIGDSSFAPRSLLAGVPSASVKTATLTANFTAGSVDARVVASMAGKELDMLSTGMAISSTNAGNAKFSGGNCTLSGGFCSMAGFFAGKSASHAGLVYSGNLFDPNTEESVGAAGAVALIRR
jgi:hypothetical protein